MVKESNARYIHMTTRAGYKRVISEITRYFIGKSAKIELHIFQ